ncbi:MAG: hypothetical protein QOH31_4721 [Verrucomicrobiota bacterium]|jgi:hypothetical protein
MEPMPGLVEFSDLTLALGSGQLCAPLFRFNL